MSLADGVPSSLASSFSSMPSLFLSLPFPIDAASNPVKKFLLHSHKQMSTAFLEGPGPLFRSTSSWSVGTALPVLNFGQHPLSTLSHRMR